MKLTTLTLPFTLLPLILPYTNAGPVGMGESFQLTSDNFKTSTSSGTWLIEFFSPFCPHCRHLAPTWTKVEEQVKEEAKVGSGKTLGVKVAQVNCVASGDVCDEEKIRGYPTLRIYKDGTGGEEFNDDRTLPKIIDFIAKHTPAQTPDPTPEKGTTTEASTETTTELNEDPVMVIQARSKPDTNLQGTVLSLNPSNFAKYADSDGVFIKFFAPWCGHCKKLAPTWVELAEKFKNKMTIAEVNCETHSKLCKSQGVEGFPMLFFYRNGNKLEYNGKRKLDALEKFIEKVDEPVVKKMGKSETLSDIMKDQEVVYVFLHLTVDHDALSLVEGAANTILLSPAVHVYTTVSPSLRSQFGQTQPGPALFVLKASPGTPAATLNALKPAASMLITRRTSRADIHTFLDRHKFGSVTELDSENFQSVMNAKVADRHVLLLATTPETKTHDVNLLRAAEARWSSTSLDEAKGDVLWAHMDGERWSSWMKSMYGLKKAAMPSFVIAHHSKLKYYDRYTDGKPFELSPEGLVKAANQAMGGILRAKNSENILERFARSANNYATAFAEMFVMHPIRMVLIMVVIIGLLAWYVTRMIGDDVGGPNHYRLYNGNGHEKRRLD